MNTRLPRKYILLVFRSTGLKVHVVFTDRIVKYATRVIRVSRIIRVLRTNEQTNKQTNERRKTNERTNRAKLSWLALTGSNRLYHFLYERISLNYLTGS